MDAEHIRELFACFRPVDVRRMFGGAGIVVDGVTFAIVFEGIVYLKTDEASLPDFEREGSQPFVYPLMKKPRTRKKPSTFWKMPERLYDDGDELARWSSRALAVAQRKKAGADHDVVRVTRVPPVRASRPRKRKPARTTRVS
jgi:DNA transformation protein